MTRLSASFGGGEETQPHPLGAGESGAFNSGIEQRGFVGGEPDVDLDGAGVVGSWPSGARHVPTIAETVSLDRDDFMGDNKS